MNPQLEVVYDYMLKRGLKLKGHRVKHRERLNYVDNSIAEIYIELSTKKGAITAFLNHLVKQEVFPSFGTAKSQLRLYAQSIGYAQTHEKRMMIKYLYEQWQFTPVTKDVNKWNKKLQEVWEDIK